MGLLLCLLVIVITKSFTLGQTPYQECGSPGVEMVNVNIENCVVNPCVLRRGTNASIAFSFTTKKTFSTLTDKVYGIVDGLPIPFTLPESDACKLGAKCPMEPKIKQSENFTIFVKEDYPQVPIIAKILLTDNKNKQQGCFEVGLVIK